MKSKKQLASLLRLNHSKRKYPKKYDSKSRLFRIWRCMRFRCYQKIHPAYKRYSSKGIKVCSDWKVYSCFMNWAVEKGYKDNLCIDRIDNLKGYCPENCRWVTYKTNNSNRCNNLMMTAFNETKALSEWARDKRCERNYKSLWRRIKKGVKLEKALKY